MSTAPPTLTGASSICTRSAKENRDRMPKTPSGLDSFSTGFSLQEWESHDSYSPLTKVYESPEFRLSWDNEISYHVANNAVRLRKLRRSSQLRVARAMGTSQSHIARIEGGDDNITLRTLKRLATALGGRIRFALEPKELAFPRLPAWWDAIDYGMAAGQALELRLIVSDDNGAAQRVVAGWTTGGVQAKNILADELNWEMTDNDASLSNQ
jgi:transcriptional regulator with XRE-family HTH domain